MDWLALIVVRRNPAGVNDIVMLPPPSATPWHFGRGFSSRENTWIPSDTQEIFEKNIRDPKKRDYLAAMGWIDPQAITYSINRFGFRSDEWQQPDSNRFMALGCSFTMGIGLPNSSVWCNVLSSMIDIPIYNLGVGGAAMDTIFRIGEYWIPILKPKFVLVLIPPPHRIEVIDHNGAGIVYASRDAESHTFMKYWVDNIVNTELNYRKNLLALTKICNDLAIPLRSYTSVPFGPARGDARDFLHLGPDQHRSMAEWICQQGDLPWPVTTK